MCLQDLRLPALPSGGGESRPGKSAKGPVRRSAGPEVAIVEREIFPRNPAGESQRPPISYMFDEVGCWDQIEAGVSYRWGTSPALWDYRENADWAVSIG